jgi:RNA polymerase sigma factor for flagellar operon FliA
MWDTYIEKKDIQARDRLLLHYLQLVKGVAGRMKIGLPGSVEYDDLVSTGLLGLINCINNFNPDRGFKFETYAVPRIRGAILDGLRDMDWLPRSYRQKTRKLDDTMTKLINELGRIPNDKEIAKCLDMSIEDYYNFIDQVGAASLVSLDVKVSTGDDGDTGSLLDIIPDENIADMMAVTENINAKETALKLIEELSKQERTVVTLYYYEDMTFREIGEVLGVSESRVCQIHTRIISTLRVRLRNLME